MLQIATDQRQALGQADQPGYRSRLGQDGSHRSVRASGRTPGVRGSHRRRRGARGPAGDDLRDQPGLRGPGDGHVHDGAGGVLARVGQSFLNDPVGGALRRGGQRLRFGQSRCSRSVIPAARDSSRRSGSWARLAAAPRPLVGVLAEHGDDLAQVA